MAGGDPGARRDVASVSPASATVSVCLPARNEAATIGAIVAEAVRLDDGRPRSSSSTTARPTTPPRSRPRPGRGSWPRRRSCPRPDRDRARATRCGSRCTRARGDIICWIDADLRNFRGEYIERLCAPLLADPDTMFVKAYYTRSFEGAPTGGGRVTELVARPLLSLLFPKLADIVQPLGGEYAARRSALEVLPFVEGWGVELGLLVDVVERFGRDAVAQVDLDVARAPQPPARRARAASARGHGHRAAARGSAARRDDAVRRAAARRARRHRSRPSRSKSASGRRSSRCRRTERVSRRLDSGFLDEQRGARVRLARLPHAIGQREHLHAAPVGRARRARRRST